MEVTVVSDILTRLQTYPAKQLETQSLEFKSWSRNEKELSYEIMDAAVCLANTAGGLIIVGVDDKKTSDAITPCPYPAVTVDLIRKWIWDLTKPPVDCNIARLGEIVPHLEGTPQGAFSSLRFRRQSIPVGIGQTAE